VAHHLGHGARDGREFDEGEVLGLKEGKRGVSSPFRALVVRYRRLIC
jgi:hypothetical protein